MKLSDIYKEVRYFLSVESLDSRIVPNTGLKNVELKEPDSKSKKGSKKNKRNYPDRSNLKSSSGNTISIEGTKPLWGTLEFKFYYVMFLIVVPWMLKVGMEASNETNPNYPQFENLLSQGWIFGRKVDNSDAQYRFFRDNLVLIFSLMSSHVILKRIILKWSNIPKIRFDFFFGIFFLIVAHGVNSLRVFAHMFIMYLIAHLFKSQRRIATILSWTYGISSLFINDNYRSYPFGDILPFLSPLDSSFKGIIERWDVFFNFSLLRMLSYNMDYLERYHTLKSNDLNKKRLDSNSNSKTVPHNTLMELSERERLTAPHPLTAYSPVNYIAYVTYTPLYIAGPIITFNDYIYQTGRTLSWINVKNIIRYAIKVFVAIMTMEIILHFAYVVAVSKRKAWEGDSPFQISMIGLLNLNIIWLKLMIPWRVFRLWAMLDGVDTPENMIRCVDNNYSAVAFWRAWHRSYNKWVVRYIYIPLGGSKRRILTSLAVFSFVAIWHDIELKLLLWGWLIVLFLLPEIFATSFCARYKGKPWFRHLCGLGAVINIWMMMIANLFGFCLGKDGTMFLLRDIFMSWSGILFFIGSSGCIFIAVQVMFEQRESEKRRGINLKC
ncbi:hypothetical protein Kpol_1002p62 [Vanderwaltozyma polyspora DSM 70294]|uniref:Glycerol uptake protein 1 n=1 Tax=Vanderwaltozyma polyspora (strain ATCC 22028 / DSM 70294 / BCRC 21397 / CBS 2163 / NBRC 10782 / NRRL Y-8283 / UCD 57-17) TaxID=436907 RepID=A7TE93_VANPO|nr:uncharacterized protein Kpol_1002p62 [Vanderwaltozyma polyspora DSM 70294]EDO19415.1 hypothetical protein Kpol_1002p62 [Vanderwaltozyma polyspora DSM 70294]